MRPLPRPLFPAVLALLVGGCAGLPSGDAIVSSSGEWLSRTGEAIGTQRERLAERFSRGDDGDPAAREAEVEALLAQPWIDPLTRFLEENAGEAQLAESLVTLSLERDRRCAAIAEEYAERPATRDNLTRYRRGYLYSCPADVNAFHARVRDEEARQVAASPAVPEPQEAEQDVVETQREAAAMERRDASDCYLYVTIRNLQQAREACAGPAEQGDARAQRHMGSLAELEGEGDEALRWFRRAAESGDQDAAARLERLSQVAEGGAREAAR